MRDKSFDQKKFKRPISDQKSMLNRKEMDRNAQNNRKEYK